MSCWAGDGSEAYFASLSVALLPHEMGSEATWWPGQCMMPTSVGMLSAFKGWSINGALVMGTLSGRLSQVGGVSAWEVMTLDQLIISPCLQPGGSQLCRPSQGEAGAGWSRRSCASLPLNSRLDLGKKAEGHPHEVLISDMRSIKISNVQHAAKIFSRLKNLFCGQTFLWAENCHLFCSPFLIPRPGSGHSEQG